MDNNWNPNNLRNLDDTGDTYVSPAMLETEGIIPLSDKILPKGDSFRQINRYRIYDNDFLASSIGYIFFTKPDLNLINFNNPTSKDSSGPTEISHLKYDTFLYAFAMTELGQKIMSSLTLSNITYRSSNNNFINILTNLAENFDTKDVQMRTTEIGENFYGYKMSVPSTFIDSVTPDSFSINYTETSDLRITYLHKVWMDYMQAVKLGTISPKEIYRKNKIIDYMSSVYFFLCGEDGQSIKYFSKLTGVYPTNVPYSGLSWQLGQGGLKRMSVIYQYSFKEDLDPQILMDFNMLTSSSATTNKNSLPANIANNWVNNAAIKEGKLIFFD